MPDKEELYDSAIDLKAKDIEHMRALMKFNAIPGRTRVPASVCGLSINENRLTLDVGSKQGVKLGMPFKVIRDNAEIGLVRVVNVRDSISGAVIQNLDSDKNKIKVGDRLQVAAQ